MIEKGIHRHNFLPGTERYTRPEEVKALNRFLKSVRETQEEHTFLEEDNLELPGKPKLPNVKGLENTRIGIDGTRQAIDLETGKLMIEGNEDQKLLDGRENLIDSRDNPKLEEGKETIIDRRGDPELWKERETIEDKPIDELGQDRLEIQGKKLTELDETLETIEAKKTPNLISKALTIETPDDIRLDRTQEKIITLDEDLRLEKERVRLRDGRELIELPTEREEIEQNRIVELEKGREELDKGKDIYLETEHLKLSGQTDPSLETGRETIWDDREPELERDREKLRVDGEAELGKEKIKLHDRQPLDRLGEERINFHDGREARLEDERVELKGKNINGLGDKKIELEDKRKIDLETGSELLEDNRRVELETGREPLKDQRKLELEKEREPLRDKRETELGTDREPLKDDTSAELGKERVELRDDTSVKLETEKEYIFRGKEVELDLTRFELNRPDNIPELPNTKSLIPENTAEEITQVSDSYAKLEGADTGINGLPNIRIDLIRPNDIPLDNTRIPIDPLPTDVDKLGDEKIGMLENHGGSKEELETTRIDLEPVPEDVENLEDKKIEMLGNQGGTKEELESTRIEILENQGGTKEELETVRIDLEPEPEDVEGLEDEKIEMLGNQGGSKEELETTRIDLEPKPEDITGIEETVIEISENQGGTKEELETTKIDLDPSPEDIDGLEDKVIEILENQGGNKEELEETRIDLDPEPEDVENLDETLIDILENQGGTKEELEETKIELDPEPEDVEDLESLVVEILENEHEEVENLSDVRIEMTENDEEDRTILDTPFSSSLDKYEVKDPDQVKEAQKFYVLNKEDEETKEDRTLWDTPFSNTLDKYEVKDPDQVKEAQKFYVLNKDDEETKGDRTILDTPFSNTLDKYEVKDPDQVKEAQKYYVLNKDDEETKEDRSIRDTPFSNTLERYKVKDPKEVKENRVRVDIDVDDEETRGDRTLWEHDYYFKKKKDREGYDDVEYVFDRDQQFSGRDYSAVPKNVMELEGDIELWDTPFSNTLDPYERKNPKDVKEAQKFYVLNKDDEETKDDRSIRDTPFSNTLEKYEVKDPKKVKEAQKRWDIEEYIRPSGPPDLSPGAFLKSAFKESDQKRFNDYGRIWIRKGEEDDEESEIPKAVDDRLKDYILKDIGSYDETDRSIRDTPFSNTLDPYEVKDPKKVKEAQKRWNIEADERPEPEDISPNAQLKPTVFDKDRFKKYGTLLKPSEVDDKDETQKDQVKDATIDTESRPDDMFPGAHLKSPVFDKSRLEKYGSLSTKDVNKSSRSSDEKGVWTPGYQLPDVKWRANHDTYNTVVNGEFLNVSNYIRWAVENTVGKIPSTGATKQKLLDETLALMILAREQLEKVSKSNKERLPGNDYGLLSDLASGNLTVKSAVKSVVSSVGKALSKSVDRSGPWNRPKGERTSKSEWVAPGQIVNDVDTTSSSGMIIGNAGGNFIQKAGSSLMGNTTNSSDNNHIRQMIHMTDPSLIVPGNNGLVGEGIGMGQTINDLFPNSDKLTSLEDLKDAVSKSRYITTPEKFTSTRNTSNYMTLDSNHVWEIIFRPYVGWLNGNCTWLPSFFEMDKINKRAFNFTTNYSSGWLPITGFEFQEKKLVSKELPLYEGSISYPIGLEFINELRISFADDSLKTLRRYFDMCAKVSAYMSNIHSGSELGYADNGVVLSKNSSVNNPTVYLEGKIHPGLYKNLSFLITIYILTPQLGTIKKSNLLAVMKDYTIENQGEIDSAPTELNLTFSIVGENPVGSSVKVRENNTIVFNDKGLRDKETSWTDNLLNNLGSVVDIF